MLPVTPRTIVLPWSLRLLTPRSRSAGCIVVKSRPARYIGMVAGPADGSDSNSRAVGSSFREALRSSGRVSGRRRLVQPYSEPPPPVPPPMTGGPRKMARGIFEHTVMLLAGVVIGVLVFVGLLSFMPYSSSHPLGAPRRATTRT